MKLKGPLRTLQISLKNLSSKFKFYSLAPDKSTNFTDKDQVASFICVIDAAFNVTAELATLYPLKGTTKSQDLLELVQSTLNQFALKVCNLLGMTTDGAPTMIEPNEG